MSKSKSIQILLVVVAILLTANLVRPLLSPTPALAVDPPAQNISITGTGNVAWVLRGNEVFYITFEKQFESIRIYGPETIED
jgi:hypothetical protein